MPVQEEVPVQNIQEYTDNTILLGGPQYLDETNKDAALIKGGFKLEILDEQNLVKLDESLRNAIQKIMEEIKPEIIENIKVTLPEIVEKLVKEEIEKIKSIAKSN